MPNGRIGPLGVVCGLIFTTLLVGVPPARAQQPEPQPAQNAAPQPQASSPNAGDPASTDPAPEKQDEGQRGSRIFGIMPNNLTVEGAKKIAPISAGEKFKLVAQSAFDPYEFAIVGVLAGIGQATDDDPSWGQGMKGYGVRYASDFGDQVIGNFMVGAV